MIKNKNIEFNSIEDANLKPYRKIIQLAMSLAIEAQGHTRNVIFALCDDGRVFWMNASDDGEWKEERQIPQD